jgi:hypothetical protein
MVAAVASAGCESSSGGEARGGRKGSLNEPAVNVDIVNMTFDQQARNAAVTERTVYPYHFAADGAELNALGLRHLEALASGSRLARPDRPLRVNVSRGEAAADLYEARVTEVRARLEAAGVEPERVTFVDEVPGGKGISTERLLTAGQDQQARPGGASGGGQSGGFRPQGMGQNGGAK